MSGNIKFWVRKLQEVSKNSLEKQFLRSPYSAMLGMLPVQRWLAGRG